jgi:hypothetical protein
MTPTNKRKAALETPAPLKSVRSTGKSSPVDGRTPASKMNGTAYVD